MPYRSSSFFGFSSSAKRKFAMLLVALWAMISLSEAFASCCVPQSGRFQRSTESFAHVHAAAATMHADHGQVDGLQQGDRSHEPVCPGVLDEQAPPAASQTALFNNDASHQLPVSPARFAWAEPTARPWVERDRIRRSLAPPDLIYLRLQHFLI